MYTTGRPGSSTWFTTMPDRISALPTAAAPARVTGAVTPAMGSPLTVTGMPWPALLRNTSRARWVKRSGPCAVKPTLNQGPGKTGFMRTSASIPLPLKHSARACFLPLSAIRRRPTKSRWSGATSARETPITPCTPSRWSARRTIARRSAEVTSRRSEPVQR